MDKDNWWEDLKRIIRETRENMNKIDSRSSKDTFFYGRGRNDDFQNSETLRKLREYEMDLREMMMKPTEQNVVTLNQPITPRVFRKNDYENEFFDYIFKHLSQGVNERNIITRLLADIQDDLKSIIKFNQNEKKKLNDLETEEFIRSQESRLMRESKDTGTNNIGDVEAITDGLKMVAKKLSNVEAQNEDMMRRLDRIYENLGEQKSGNQRALMDELRGIVKTLNNLSDKSNFARHIGAKKFKEVHPVRPAPVELPQMHRQGKDYVVESLSSSDVLNLPWEFKTKQQLMWEYEDNKRQLKLLEEEGFQSPDFLRRGYHGRLSPFLTSGSDAGGHSKAKSKRTRFSDQECSTDADLTIEDLS